MSSPSIWIKNFVILFLFGIASNAIAQVNYEIPRTSKEEQIIHHAGFALVYAEPYEQAKWVAYELTAGETRSAYERTNHFLTDPKIATGSANDDDYSGSGYDRGHLAPAADMGWSEASMVECFYYSNMSPQLPGFNRGIWKRLEEQVRDWAVAYGSIYVVTGPVLKAGLYTIGANKVAIPELYYKVILDTHPGHSQAIGFLMPNASSTEGLSGYAVSVDAVEKATGIDFFYQLPDDQETKLEGSVCTACWQWNAHKASSSGSHSSSDRPAVQCSGTTKAGARCKRMTKSENGRCYQHGGN